MLFLFLFQDFLWYTKRDKINVRNVASKLLIQQGFAATILVIVSTIVYCLNKATSGRYIGLQSITGFNSMSWYVGYYFCVILIAFLFLNKFLAGLDKSKYATFLIVIFAFIQFGWSGGLADSLASGLRVLCTGIFLYSLGGYIKLYDPFENVKSFTFLLTIIVVYGFIYVSNYNLTIRKIEDYIRNGSQGDFIQAIEWYDNFSIIIMILSVSLFVLFKRIHIPNNRFINFLGASTFMVYLVHDNDFAYNIWDTQDWITLLYNHPYHFIIKLGIWTLLTFTAGVVIYCLYLLLIKIFQKSKKIFLKS